MFAIYKKELRSYFINAIGFVYVGVFLATAAILLCYTTLAQSSYNTDVYFNLLIFSFIILIPLLTMKLFAEEKKLKTEQLLLTAPVTIWEMVLGKFFAAFTIFAGSLLASCVYFFPLYSYAAQEKAALGYESSIPLGPSTPRIIGCIIGVMLIGAAFIAVGVFVSSLTENQLAAAVITVAIIMVMLLMFLLNQFIDVYAIRFIIEWFCVFSRFSNFANGFIDFGSLIYYISITGIFLLLTVRVYDKRRWG